MSGCPSLSGRLEGECRVRPYIYQAKFAGGLETPLANAFPAWNLARRSLLMQTNATAWDKN